MYKKCPWCIQKIYIVREKVDTYWKKKPDKKQQMEKKWKESRKHAKKKLKPTKEQIKKRNPKKKEIEKETTENAMVLGWPGSSHT